MAIKIIKATEALEVKNIIMLIYGKSGSGKTSLACTADKPLLLDFEKGSHRAKNRCDTVQISSKDELENLLRDDLSNYNTIIIDTLSHLLMVLLDAISGTRKPNPSTWGTLSTYFRSFLLKLKSLNKNIIFLLQVKETQDGDIIKYDMDGIGNAKNFLYQDADVMGYLKMLDKQGYLNFDRNEKAEGKNCANLEPQMIPHYDLNNKFLDELMIKAKDNINKENKLQAEKKLKEEEILTKIATADIDVLNELLADKFIQDSKNRYFKVEMFQRSKDLGLEYDSTTKQFKTNQ